MSTVKNSKKRKKKSKNPTTVLSDSKIKELHSELVNKENYSKHASNLSEDFVEKGTSILKSGEKLSDSAIEVTMKGLKNVENEFTEQKPKFDKIKNKASEELNEFTKKSTTTLKNTQSSLKGFGNKFFGKTKKEFSEGSDYLEKNIPTVKNRFNEEIKDGAESVQKNAPKIGRKIKGSFLDSIEKTHGASTKGKQYGAQSVSILKQIGELKEAGLITEKEYLQKKKELLGKI